MLVHSALPNIYKNVLVNVEINKLGLINDVKVLLFVSSC